MARNPDRLEERLRSRSPDAAVERRDDGKQRAAGRKPSGSLLQYRLVGPNAGDSFPSCFADTSPQPIAVRVVCWSAPTDRHCRLCLNTSCQDRIRGSWLPQTDLHMSARTTSIFVECCSSAALCAAWPVTYRFSCFGLEKCVLLCPCWCLVPVCTLVWRLCCTFQPGLLWGPSTCRPGQEHSSLQV